MPIPKSGKDYEKVILEELRKAGGELRTQDIFERLLQRFGVTEAEREQVRFKGKYKDRKFDWGIYTAMVRMRKQGWIEPVENSGKGIYKLTPAGWEVVGRTEGRREFLKVKSAEKATEIAHSYLSKYFSPTLFALRPTKVNREGDVWLVEIDVGLFETKIAQVRIDANTEAILEYVTLDKR